MYHTIIIINLIWCLPNEYCRIKIQINGFRFYFGSKEMCKHNIKFLNSCKLSHSRYTIIVDESNYSLIRDTYDTPQTNNCRLGFYNVI